MEHEISNLVTYINSMSVTLYDKCWWIDKIPANIDTVIDFGCAGGDLAHMINRIMPDRFNYIGVDNSPIMLQLAKHNKTFANYPMQFYPNIKEIPFFKPENTILVLNSVIHEIYTYMVPEAVATLFTELFNSGFAYIAIRDMYVKEPPNYIDYAIERLSSHPKWLDFTVERGVITPKDVVEFLLKYHYDANWDRECREQYLWFWFDDFQTNYAKGYDVNFYNAFYIPYLKDKIYKDFGIDLNCDTHLKVLYKKTSL